MTQEQIEAVIAKHSLEPVYEIRFKARNQLKGLFIKTPDYPELSRKNLWRIVSESYIEEYKKTSNQGLARIFNGTDFTKLEVK